MTGPARDLPAGFKVVFAGNIGKAQSMETLIKAAGLLREHEDIRWIIVGDGSERETTEAQIRELGLSGRVHFTGRLPAESMPEYFAMGDALLVFLKRDPIFSYTIPSRLQSYWACARPVIAALDGEGQRVILESGGGLVGATEDEKALAENVLAVYKMSPEQREEMGQKGLAYYRRHFDREPLLLRLEALLSAMVKKK